MKYFIIIVSFFVFAFVNKPQKVQVGYYATGGGYSHEGLNIFRDSTFTSNSSSCTYSYDYKGKWHLKSDTLIAVANEIRNQRFEKLYTKCEPEVFCYLVRKNTMILLVKDSLGVSTRLTVLSKEDPDKPQKRQKF